MTPGRRARGPVGRMGPRTRKLLLTVHVSVSVGWLGAVSAFLALAVAALRSGDPAVVRGAYLAMDVTGWWVLVPLSVACLLTGVVQSLGTHWGLVRHYWVLATLVINIVATALLVLFMGTLAELAVRGGNHHEDRHDRRHLTGGRDERARPGDDRPRRASPLADHLARSPRHRSRPTRASS